MIIALMIKSNHEENNMNIQEACQILRLTPTRPLEALKRSASGILAATSLKCPLKHKVALRVILAA